MERLSRNFVRSEFECSCGCGADEVRGGLIDVVQRMRDRQGVPLRVVSGVRCAARNKAVGGSRSSQHLVGRAADVPGGYATATQWHAAGAIGVGIRGGRVVHVDVRPGRRPFVFDD